MRLFFAIELGSDIQRCVSDAIDRVRPVARHARWSRPEAMHVTLAFLGEQSEDLLPQLLDVGARAVAGQPAFALSVHGSGTFGSARAPRVLWLGFEGAVDHLRALQHSVATLVKGLGIALEERPFSPHLTLARSKLPRGDRELTGCAEALAEVRCGPVTVERLILFQSQLGPGGSRYTERGSFLLAAG